MIRSGEEDGDPLVCPPRAQVGSQSAVKRVYEPLSPKSEPRDPPPEELLGDGGDVEKIVKQQEDIFKAMKEPESALPAWAGGAGSSAPAAARPGSPLSAVMGGVLPREFAKKAAPPTRSQVPEEEVLPSPPQARAHPKSDTRCEPVEAFGKRAIPPKDYRPFEPELKRPSGRRSPGPKLTATSMAAREVEAREVYHDMTMMIYDRLKAIGVTMELSEIVEEDRCLDVNRFRALTSPNRAATGLGYARLLVRLLNWHDTRKGLSIRTGVDAQLGILGLHGASYSAEGWLHDAQDPSLCSGLLLQGLWVRRHRGALVQG